VTPALNNIIIIIILGTTSYFTSWPLPLLFLFNYHLGILNTKCSSQLHSCSFGPPALGEPYLAVNDNMFPDFSWY